MAFRARRQQPHISFGPARPRSWVGVAAILVASIAALAPGGSARADDFTPDQRKAIEAIVRDYLMKNPEILIDAFQVAEEKIKSDAHDKAAQALIERHRDIYEDPDSPIAGNPNGDVSLVEFFDYRCPYCKQVEPALDALVAQDQKLRIIYKEFPVLGAQSVMASRAALAARRQGKYDAFHAAMMAVKGQLGEATVFTVAASVGIDVERLKLDMAAPETDRALKATSELADALEIRGTPAFIIGKHIIPGAVDLNTLRRLIAEARGKSGG